jgi:hypothetical protein
MRRAAAGHVRPTRLGTAGGRTPVRRRGFAAAWREEETNMTSGIAPALSLPSSTPAYAWGTGLAR